jgi:hypothetical protein
MATRRVLPRGCRGLLPWAIAECLLVHKQVGGSMLTEDMFDHACEATRDMLGWGRPRSGVPLPHPATARTHTQPLRARTHTHNAGCALSGCLITA